MTRPSLVHSNRVQETPERAALREQIALHKSRQADIANLEKAIETADRDYWSAVSARSAAEDALTAAPDKYAEYLAEKACGRDIARPLTIKEAEAALLEANEALNTARKVRDLLNGKLLAASSPIRLNPNKVRDAALAVIRSETDARAVFDDIMRLQRQLVSKRLALRWLTINRCVPATDSSQPNYDPAAPRNPDRDDELPSTRRQIYEGPAWWTELDGEQPFEAAARSLLEDPNAPVPSL